MNTSWNIGRRSVLAAMLALSAALPLPPARAQTQTVATGIVVTPLLRADSSAAEGLEAVVVMAEFAPGASTGRHFHLGDEYATVLQGTLELRVDGQPPQRIEAGQAYHNAKGVIHQTRNVGELPVRLSSTFIVEKNKPLLQPVP